MARYSVHEQAWVKISLIMGFFRDLLKKISGNSPDQSSTKTETQIDEAYIEDLEASLIRSDLGTKLALDFCEQLREQNSKSPINTNEVSKFLEAFLLDAFGKVTRDPELFKLKIQTNTLNVILVVGVNGVGKTTSIGKLAHKFKQEGHKVLIAAGDTFRAAAEEQLDLWAQRAGVDILRLEDDAKPSTVVYKALERSQQEGYEVLIIDTAGRLQSKQNLMEELAKLKQVISKNAPQDHHLETMLVLDASTGSNALSQAEKFNEVTQLNSIILTKFDGTARGGMVFALAHQFGLPVKFIGTGEDIEDLQEFDIQSFIAKYFE